MRSHYHTAGHIRWHDHKSHDTRKEVEYSERNNVIQYVTYMLTLRCIHGHLGWARKSSHRPLDISI